MMIIVNNKEYLCYFSGSSIPSIFLRENDEWRDDQGYRCIDPEHVAEIPPHDWCKPNISAMHHQNSVLRAKVDELHEMIDHKQAHIESLKSDIKPWLGADLEIKGHQVEELKHEMKMDKLAHREEVIGLKETIMELREKLAQ